MAPPTLPRVSIGASNVTYWVKIDIMAVIEGPTMAFELQDQAWIVPLAKNNPSSLLRGRTFSYYYYYP